MNKDEILSQQEKDRADLAALPSGKNKPLSWCSEHDCQMGTCFSLHYPESSLCYQNSFISKNNQDETFSFETTLRKELSNKLDARMWSEKKEIQENWKKLWEHSQIKPDVTAD